MNDMTESSKGRKRQKTIIPIPLDTIWFIVLSTVIFLNSCSPTQQPITNIKPGISAPDFSLNAVRGGNHKLADLHGQAVLLSFINTQGKVTAAKSDPSRAQIVFLKSMQEQYAAKGLSVWIVDATRQETGNQPGPNELINFTYDWQLDMIPVLTDENSDVAKAFGVSSTPTTFLIDADGVIQQRWDGIASSSQLGLSIEVLLGAPAYRSTELVVTNQPRNCPGELFPQAKFAGVGLARPLSEEIWVVDNGKAWGYRGNFPLQWIVIDSHSKSETDDLHLRVTAHYSYSTNILVLVDQDLSLLPESEARGLLATQNDDAPKIYFLATTINLDQTGCLQLKADVSEGTSLLYDGQVLVPVDH